MEAFGEVVHSFGVAAEGPQHFPFPRQPFRPPAVFLPRVLEHKFLGLFRHLQKLGVISKVVIQETVNPDGAPQKPEVLARIEEGAVVIQTAHEAAIFVVDSVLVPEGQKNLEELVVKPLAQFRQAHARQPQFRR